MNSPLLILFLSCGESSTPIFIPPKKEKVSKVDYSSKAKIPNVRDFLVTKNTVVAAERCSGAQVFIAIHPHALAYAAARPDEPVAAVTPKTHLTSTTWTKLP